MDLIPHYVLYKLIYTQLHLIYKPIFQPGQTTNQNVAHSLLIDI